MQSIVMPRRDKLFYSPGSLGATSLVSCLYEVSLCSITRRGARIKHVSGVLELVPRTKLWPRSMSSLLKLVFVRQSRTTLVMQVVQGA